MGKKDRRTKIHDKRNVMMRKIHHGMLLDNTSSFVLLLFLRTLCSTTVHDTGDNVAFSGTHLTFRGERNQLNLHLKINIRIHFD